MRITADCNLAANRTGRRGCRAGYFPDLDPAPPLPTRAFRVIAGGRRPSNGQ